MSLFSQTTVEFTSERLTQSGSKSSYSEHTATGFGYYRTLDDKLAEINSLQIGEGSRFIIEPDHDIIVTDKIIINSQKYEVRGVKRETMGSIDVKECLLVKSDD